MKTAGPTTMAPLDAFMYWLGLRIPNDQFLLYAFDGPLTDVEEAIGQVRRRALSHPDFRIRIADRVRLGFPVWEPCALEADHFVQHRAQGCSWVQCLDVLVDVMVNDQLDPSSSVWRLHLFPAVDGVPGATKTSTVAVLQSSHALGDGRYSSALAAHLFGRRDAIPTVSPRRVRWYVPRTIAARRWRRILDRDVAAGHVPPAPELVPVLSSNTTPDDRRVLRTVLLRRSEMPTSTVTVGALTAISEALGGVLAERGEDVSMLSAQIAMAYRDARTARNHWESVGVRLYPDTVSRDDRAKQIDAEFDDWRRRQEHPAFAAKRRAFDAMPAVLRRWGTARANFEVQPEAIVGNTVVTSVHRGPTDLTLGGKRVFLTAGYPAIFPMAGITHGIHGIGDTVAISVHTAPSVVGDVDEYVDRLLTALRP